MKSWRAMTFSRKRRFAASGHVSRARRREPPCSAGSIPISPNRPWRIAASHSRSSARTWPTPRILPTGISPAGPLPAARRRSFRSDCARSWVRSVPRRACSPICRPIQIAGKAWRATRCGGSHAAQRLSALIAGRPRRHGKLGRGACALPGSSRHRIRQSPAGAAETTWPARQGRAARSSRATAARKASSAVPNSRTGPRTALASSPTARPSNMLDISCRRLVWPRQVFAPAAVERLSEKCRSGQAIGFADNMAFVGILSTMILEDQFVQGNAPE